MGHAARQTATLGVGPDADVADPHAGRQVLLRPSRGLLVGQPTALDRLPEALREGVLVDGERALLRRLGRLVGGVGASRHYTCPSGRTRRSGENPT